MLARSIKTKSCRSLKVWEMCAPSYGTMCFKQGRIHGYPSRVRVGRGPNRGHFIIWAGAVRPETSKTQKK